MRRDAAAAPPAASISSISVGTTCHATPKRSLIHPHLFRGRIGGHPQPVSIDFLLVLTVHDERDRFIESATLRAPCFVAWRADPGTPSAAGIVSLHETHLLARHRPLLHERLRR
jgi:hypothetical protein